jgi:hypothetical protein
MLLMMVYRHLGYSRRLADSREPRIDTDQGRTAVPAANWAILEKIRRAIWQLSGRKGGVCD